MNIELLKSSREITREVQQRERDVYTLLDSLGIQYELAVHDAAADMDACDAVSAAVGVDICKNLFLCNRQQTHFYLLLMPAHKPFKTKELSAQINSARLSFAGEEHMKQLLNILPGSVSVMGLMNDKQNRVELLIDEDLLGEGFLGCHPCVNTATIKLKTADVLNVFLPFVKHTYTKVTLKGTD